MKRITTIVLSIILIFSLSLTTFGRASLYIQDYGSAMGCTTGRISYSVFVAAVKQNSTCKVEGRLMEQQDNGSFKKVDTFTKSANFTDLVQGQSSYNSPKAGVYYYVDYTVYVENGGSDTRTSSGPLGISK